MNREGCNARKEGTRLTGERRRADLHAQHDRSAGVSLMRAGSPARIVYDSAERTVATFTDPDSVSRVGDYDITIKWGDGTSSGGWVRRASAGFEVRGRHVYGKAKTFAVTVKIDKTKVSSTAVVSR
jgi:hypothetical protein